MCTTAQLVHGRHPISVRHELQLQPLQLATWLFSPGGCYSVTQVRCFPTPSMCTTAPTSLGQYCSLLWRAKKFCVPYFRGLSDTCSSYVLMPCTFVFVLIVRSPFIRTSRLVAARRDCGAARNDAAVSSSCYSSACGATDYRRPETACYCQCVRLFDCCCYQRVFGTS